MLTLKYSWLAGDHSSYSCVGEQLHEQRVRLSAINDVSCRYTLRQTSDAALHPVLKISILAYHII